jgi:hypothetical protein
VIEVINNIDDVKIFIKHLYDEGVNLHPDDDFRLYINIKTGAATYTYNDALLRNKLMTQAFEVCELFNKDIYNLVQEIYLIETGLDKYIPLPSSLKS